MRVATVNVAESLGLQHWCSTDVLHYYWSVYITNYFVQQVGNLIGCLTA